MPQDCAGVRRANTETATGGSKVCIREMAPVTRKQYQRYAELIDELVGMGAIQQDCYQFLSPQIVVGPNTWGRKHPHIPSLRRGDPIRGKLMDYLFQCIINRIDATKNGLVSAGGVNTDDWTEEDYRAHYNPTSAEHAICGKKNAENARAAIRAKIISAQSHPAKVATGKSSGLTTRIVYLREVNSLGQMAFLTRVQVAGYADDDYAAHCILYKKGMEKIEEELTARGSGNAKS